jgi:WG repeat protein
MNILPSQILFRWVQAVVIDFKFQYANNFEHGRAKVEINNFWGAIDKTGKLIEPATHKYASDW